MIATAAPYAAALSAGTLHLFRIEDGTAIKRQTLDLPGSAYMAASEQTLFIGSSDNLTRKALPELEIVHEETTPVPFGALSVEGEHRLAASRSGEVRELTEGKWNKLPVAAVASSLCFGLQGTFWITGVDAESGKPFAGQFNKDGEFLRAYQDEFAPVRVCASTAIEEIAVLETKGSGQRLRVLSLVEKNPDASGKWAIAFEKTIEDCRRFGIVDGKLVADAGSAPQADQVNITLSTGGLTASSTATAIRVTFDDAGLWLETRSGLKLAFLAAQPNVSRVVLLLSRERIF